MSAATSQPPVMSPLQQQHDQPQQQQPPSQPLVPASPSSTSSSPSRGVVVLEFSSPDHRSSPSASRERRRTTRQRVSRYDQSTESDASARFLSRTTDRFLAFYMVVVVVTTTAVLVRNRDNSSPNDQDSNLKTWLIVNAVLLVFRNSGRICMHSFPSDGHARSKFCLTWFFRVLSFVYIGWFITGIVYLSEVEELDFESTVQLLTTVIIVFEMVSLCVSILLALFIFFFALRPVLNTHTTSPGATPEDLSRLKTYKYVSTDDQSPNAQTQSDKTCSICLCEYQQDEVLRELPCAVGKHVFHASCVDAWLTQNLSCPICRDDPLGRLPADSAESIDHSPV